jgi:uncharacterized protein
MSAANASIAPSPSHPDETRANEPSMEEILASIRRIIADDQTLPGNRREREERRRRADEATPSAAVQDYDEPALDAAPHVDEEVDELEDEAPQAPVADIRHLRLSRTVVEAVHADEEAEHHPVEEDDAEEVEASAYVLDYVAPAEPEPAVAHVNEPLVSANTASSVASHFEALATSMIIKDQGLLQQYAQEMMRPMLKQWLDDNLPTIVERLVRAEIERVARGGRR